MERNFRKRAIFAALPIAFAGTSFGQEAGGLDTEPTALNPAPIVLEGAPEILTGGEEASNMARIFPSNLLLFLAETSAYRLRQDDLISLGVDVEIAIWPDSDLVEAGGYYLQVPPNDPLQSFQLPEIVNDEAGLYAAAIDASKGIVIENMPFMQSSNPLSRKIYKRLSEWGKEAMVVAADFDLAPIIANTEIILKKPDFLLIPNHPEIALYDQWLSLLSDAQYGEEIVAFVHLNEGDMAALIALFERLRAESGETPPESNE